METLGQLLRRAGNSLEPGWLYLPRSERWTVDTRAIIIDSDSLSASEIDKDDEPLFAKERDLVVTLDSGTIESIVSFARQSGFEITDELLLESFLYYYDHDAFLPEPGFKPLPLAESQLKLDREFYEMLGDEREEPRCRKDGCARGAIIGSVLCKSHHFEMVQHKPCPFSE